MGVFSHGSKEGAKVMIGWPCHSHLTSLKGRGHCIKGNYLWIQGSLPGSPSKGHLHVAPLNTSTQFQIEEMEIHGKTSGKIKWVCLNVISNYLTCISNFHRFKLYKVWTGVVGHMNQFGNSYRLLWFVPSLIIEWWIIDQSWHKWLKNRGM